MVDGAFLAHWRAFVSEMRLRWKIRQVLFRLWMAGDRVTGDERRIIMGQVDACRQLLREHHGY